MSTAEKKKLNLVKGSSIFKLYIPVNVESKIRHLCSVIHDVEWSGTLFYTHKGSIEDGDFEIMCVDLFVMDIGSSGYTEFNESADVVNYRINHDLLDPSIQEGLIHSHNNMATFFSGTDKNTLVEEGTNSNHFVSLIVNNAGKYTAAFTRKLVTELNQKVHINYTENKYYNTYGNDKVILENETEKEKTYEHVQSETVIEYFDLDIIKEEYNNSFLEIDERLNEIRKNKVKVVKPAATAKTKQPSLFPMEDNKSLYERTFYDDYYDSYYDYYNDEYRSKASVKSGADPYYENDFMAEEICLNEEFDKNIIEKISMQLLSSCIIVNHKTLDAKTWVSKMDNVYAKQFNGLDDPRLREWFEHMVEFVIYTEDKALLKRMSRADGYEYTGADTSELCAYCIYKYLKTLPESKVKTLIMDLLEDNIPNGILKLIGD